MIYILNINTQRFSINGIPYFKNFMPHVAGNYLRIVNAYDTKFEIAELNHFNQFSVNGVVHSSVLNLQNALLPILYTRDSLNGIVQDSPYFNKFTNGTGFTFIDQDLTINAGWAWDLSGYPYSNPSNVVINIPYAASGKHRIDTILANTDNTFYRVPGIEVDIADSPAEPAPVTNTLRFTIIPVNESGYGDIQGPIVGDNFRVKIEKSETYVVFDNTVDTLNIGQSASYRLMGSMETIHGINQLIPNILYDGREFTFFNAQATPVTLPHLSGITDFQFSLPGGQDLILNPGDFCKVKFSKIAGSRLELVCTNKLKDFVPFDIPERIKKGYGNTNPEDEIGDIFKLWNNDGSEYYDSAKWNGGDQTDSGNFTPLVRTGM